MFLNVSEVNNHCFTFSTFYISQCKYMGSLDICGTVNFSSNELCVFYHKFRQGIDKTQQAKLNKNHTSVH